MRRTRVVAALATYAAMLPIAALLVDVEGDALAAVAIVLVALLLTGVLLLIYTIARRGTAEGLAAVLFPKRAIRMDAEGWSAVAAAEARRDVDGALRRAADLVAANPEDAALAFLAAELYLRHARTDDAVALLRRVRLDGRMPAGERLRASNRLVDVHLVRPDDRALAMRELRTIVREHAGSAAAAGAARLLAELTAELETTGARVRAGVGA
jgi:hypothetical protein